ncbi:MAG: hypothetical protein LBW85_04305 [Deltaproteobacteria bacterium]|jgi:hypothetical protein|nr:hypothetical protein [Deltaproteobacteria bacterium]
MKALPTTAAAALVLALAFLLSGCSSYTRPSLAGTPLEKFPDCVRSSSSFSRLPRANFQAFASGSCIRSQDPFDYAAWVEAPIVSFKERGLATLALGCANLVPDASGCEYAGLPGHSTTLSMNFNFAAWPASARVQKAVLAFYVENNAAFFRENAEIRGRLNIGDQLQSLGAPRTGPPGSAGWITVDITDFAARAVSEQRVSASFEISLPCGRDESEITTVRLTKTLPVVVVEYK